MEAEEPAPERASAPAFLKLEAKRFGEPIKDSGEDGEYDARDDHMMEVCDQKHAVVHLPVNGRHGQQHAGQATQDEGHHEADRPQNRHRESDTPRRTS